MSSFRSHSQCRVSIQVTLIPLLQDGTQEKPLTLLPGTCFVYGPEGTLMLYRIENPTRIELCADDTTGNQVISMTMEDTGHSEKS